MDIGTKPMSLNLHIPQTWLSTAATMVLVILGSTACVSTSDAQTDNGSTVTETALPTAQPIVQCPRQFTGWDLVNQFETATYSLALCQQGDEQYLVGHEKRQHEAFIEAAVLELSDESVVAADTYGFRYEITADQLTVIKDDQIISQEPWME